MYRIIIVNSSGGPLAVEHCRISALSSAEYLLGQRREVNQRIFAWQGSKESIERLIKAEHLEEAPLARLREGQDYRVLFCA